MAAANRTVSEVYVTVSDKGTRYYTRGRHHAIAMRLFPISRELAEASFAAGATVYRKQPGTSIWQPGGVEVITEAAA